MAQNTNSHSVVQTNLLLSSSIVDSDIVIQKLQTIEPSLELDAPLCKQEIDTKKKFPKKIFSTRNFFLTIPNFSSPEPLTVYWHKLYCAPFFDQLRGAILAQEFHKDQTRVHFHLLLCFTKRKSIYKNDFFDFLFNKHPHFEQVKSLKASIKYITKDDNYLHFGDLLNTHIKDTKEQIINFLNNPSRKLYDLQSISSKPVDFVLFNEASKSDLWYRRTQTWHHYKSLAEKPWLQSFDLTKLNTAPDALQPYVRAIRPVLAAINPQLDLTRRRLKSPNFLMWSHNPNTGKSSFFQFLEKRTSTFTWPLDFWFPNYYDGLQQIILWDEFAFHGNRIEFLKLLFDGHPLTLPVKGSHNPKRDNPVILCASNHDLRELFRFRFPFHCACNAAHLNEHELCRRHATCTTTEAHLFTFKAFTARIFAIPITDPIFPDGTANPALWDEWTAFLDSCIIWGSSYADVHASETTPLKVLFNDLKQKIEQKT